MFGSILKQNFDTNMSTSAGFLLEFSANRFLSILSISFMLEFMFMLDFQLEISNVQITNRITIVLLSCDHTLS